MKTKLANNIGPMLNAYPDSLGGKLSDIHNFLELDDLKDVFKSFYILPSVFNTDLDRGFSVIDYDLNTLYATKKDLKDMQQSGIDFKFDFVLNHASVLSKQFQDIIVNGLSSKYIDFFIDWNKFWKGYGTMSEKGYIQPQHSYIKEMFFRKPGLPILFVRMPDGQEIPFWNTFYQKIYYDKPDVQDLMKAMELQYTTASVIANIIAKAIDSNVEPSEMEFYQFSHLKDQIVEYINSRRKYLGQMDLNIKSPMVWKFYEETLTKLSGYGARIIRLDAFAYASKEPGAPNFMNEPGIWRLLERINEMAGEKSLMLLPEIHAEYSSQVHKKMADHGYMIYDFFLPGLLIQALEKKNVTYLVQWGNEIVLNRYKTVNMLGCHDGIPLLDLRGFISDEEIEELIETVVSRGGYVKDLHGKKNMYYQVNATFYSALDSDDANFMIARAIQLFMPGKPQIWYLDLFAGENNYEAVRVAGPGGHKEINRTNLSWDDMLESMKKPIVQHQLQLIRFRNKYPTFREGAVIEIKSNKASNLLISWEYEAHKATLNVDLDKKNYKVQAFLNGKEEDWQSWF